MKLCPCSCSLAPATFPTRSDGRLLASSWHPDEQEPPHVSHSATFAPVSGAETAGRPNIVQRLVLGLVWLTVASGAVVFSEPAPVDVLTTGLVIALPLVGLAAVRMPLLIVLAVWLAAAAGALVASAQSPDIARSATHALISLYLYAAFFTFACFVARDPARHTKLILDAYLWAAFIGAVGGVIGYFNLLPGAAELMTKYGRAAGTFKDPNVYGPFLGPALLYALHRVLHERAARKLLAGVMLGFLSFAVLLSFSRGAWFNASVGVATYLYFTIVLAPSIRQRARLIGLGVLAATLAAGTLLLAAQFDGVGDLLSKRAALTQSYDEGPEGRFGGQHKAQGLILANPLGLGALQFGSIHHHEDVHNVYLSMFLNAGWVGGFAFAAMMLTTAVWGLLHLLRPTATRHLFLIAYAAFLGNVLEGFVVDIDHWRHLYLMMAIVWGLMVSERAVIAPAMTAAVRRLPMRRPARIRGFAHA